MSHFARFPINTLKIDKPFTLHQPDDSHQAGVVKAITTIAHSLNQQVVVEGGSYEQAAILKAYGYHIAQGYLYGKPAAKTAF